MSQTYDEFFQQHYVAHLLRDPLFFLNVREDLSPELFTSEQAQSVVRLVIGWAEEHDAPPGELIFTEIDNLQSIANIDAKKINPLKLYIKKLLAVPLQNRKFLLDEHNKFLAHQKLLEMYPQFSEAMRLGEHEKAREMLTSVVTFSASHGRMGVFHSADPTERIARRMVQDEDRFWLCISEIDRAVNGLKRGQVGLWQSQRSSVGKTAALIHQIKAFVIQRKRVLVFTLEDGQEEYEDKLDMCVAGVTSGSLMDGERIQRYLERLYRGGQWVHIVEFPAGVRVSELRRYQRFLENTQNWRPDAVLLDYVGLLSPETKELRGDMFQSGHEIIMNLNRWAREEAVCIWTAEQSGRGAIEAVVADQQHIATSLAKVWDVHLIISINRTAEEQQEGITQLHVVKNKNGPARFTRAIRSDFERMHFYVQNAAD